MAGLADVLARSERPEQLLALAASSHSGEPRHLEAVVELLGLVGLDPSALRATPALPLGEARRAQVLREGGTATSLQADCSGKHAAALATCRAAGWSVDGYLEPEHPVQVALRRDVEALVGPLPATPTTDGCGMPLLPTTLPGLARSGAVLVDDRVGRAMRAHPEVVGGTGRDVSALLRAGLLAKDGAEGVQLLAAPGGAAVALKVSDGAGRARLVATTAVLGALVEARLLGDAHDGVVAALDGDPVLADPAVRGGGRPVGGVRAAPGLVGRLRAALGLPTPGSA